MTFVSSFSSLKLLYNLTLRHTIFEVKVQRPRTTSIVRGVQGWEKAPGQIELTIFQLW